MVSPPRNSTVSSSIECATWAAVITLPSAEIRTPEPVSLNVEMPRAAVTSRPFARTTTTEGLMFRNSSPTSWACAASAPPATRIPTSPAPTLVRSAMSLQPEEIEQDGGERARHDDEADARHGARGRRRPHGGGAAPALDARHQAGRGHDPPERQAQHQ